MNPALLAALAEKNPADIEAIIAKIGIPTLLSLLPHLIAILTTIQQQGKTP
jgi:hypothetical protein